MKTQDQSKKAASKQRLVFPTVGVLLMLSAIGLMLIVSTQIPPPKEFRQTQITTEDEESVLGVGFWPSASQWRIITQGGGAVADEEDRAPNCVDSTKGTNLAGHNDYASQSECSTAPYYNPGSTNPAASGSNTYSAAIYYDDANGDSNGCANISDDYMYFRARVAGAPNETNPAQGLANAKWWTILDTNQDNLPDFYIILDGGGNISGEQIDVYYETSGDFSLTGEPLVYTQPAPVTNGFVQWNPTPDNGTYGDATEYFLDWMVPLTAFQDGGGSQILCQGQLPILSNYTTTDNLNNAFQRDYIMNQGVFSDPYVLSAPNYTITKTAIDVNGNLLVPGDEVEYTIVIQNLSNTQTNVNFSDTIPVGSTFVTNAYGSGSGIQATINGTTYNMTNIADSPDGSGCPASTNCTADFTGGVVNFHNNIIYTNGSSSPLYDNITIKFRVTFASQGTYYNQGSGTTQQLPNQMLSDDPGIDDGTDCTTAGAYNCNEGITGNDDPTPVTLAADADGDGIVDSVETLLGSNPNNPDSDGDGVYDTYEAPSCVGVPSCTPQDSDGDTTPDLLDTDDDGDGIPSSSENNDPDADGNPSDAVDSDGDSTPDYLDADDDNDGIPTSSESSGDTDSDGFADYLDLDADDDGLEDNGIDFNSDGLTETSAGTTPTNADSDYDGLPDGLEVGVSTAVPSTVTIGGTSSLVADGDAGATTTDPNDDDTDDDGLLDGTEDFNTDGVVTNTIGGTGTSGSGETDPNNPDTDGDGIQDGTESGLGAPEGSDTNPAIFIPDGDAGATQTDPLDTDTDDGTLIDGGEDLNSNGIIDGAGEKDPNNGVDDTLVDSDSDGIYDSVELSIGSDPGNPDSDGDGVLDTYEAPSCVSAVSCTAQDTDSDTTPDINDMDDDGDGVDSIYEGNDPNTDGDPSDAQDTDSDGTPDYLDSDDDDDGIPSSSEGNDPNTDGDPSDAQDTDGDTTPDYLDTDDDGDGILTALESTGDSDSDGNPDYLDIDSDDDGVYDQYEAPSCVGVSSCTPQNTDGDSFADMLDPDDDNDGILSEDENNDPNSDGNPADAHDTDGDTTPDYLDNDDDNDGIYTNLELATDSDSDGANDYLDIDSDNDGAYDQYEAPSCVGVTSCTPQDHDSDGTPDLLDPDDDDDGIDSALENNDPNLDGDPSDALDSDGDGDVDYLDVDDDDDGILTEDEDTGDTDGDGFPDYLDRDSDDDGLEDNGVDYNGDGLTEDTCLTDPTDSDSDNDGILDGVECGISDGVAEGTNIGGTSDPIVDGDGGSTTTDPNDDDTDGDGIKDGDEDTNQNGVFEPELGETDPNTPDEAPTLVTSALSMTISKGANPASGTVLLPEDTIEYTLYFENTSQTTLSSIEIIDLIPEGSLYQEDSLTLNGTDLTDKVDSDPGRFNSTSNQIIVKPDNLDPGESGSVTFKVTIRDLEFSKEGITNDYTFKSYETGNIISNQTNHPVDPIEVTKVAKDLNGGKLEHNDEILWTITIRNIGLSQTTHIVMNDTIPDYLEYVEDSIRGRGADDSDSPDLVWEIGVLQIDEEIEVSFKTKIKDNAPYGTEIKNQATLTCDQCSAVIKSDDPETSQVSDPTAVATLEGPAILMLTGDLSRSSSLGKFISCLLLTIFIALILFIVLRCRGKKVYYPSQNSELKEIKPSEKISTEKDPVTIATDDPALASCFLVPTDKSWARVLRFDPNGPWNMVIYGKTKFKKKDKGGTIYQLSGKRFKKEKIDETGTEFWISTQRAKVTDKVEYDSALEAMQESGVKVYFVDKKTFKKIVEAKDLGESIIGKLKSR